MRTFNALSHRINVVAALATLASASCSGSSSPVAPTTIGQLTTTGERGHQVFQADPFNIVRAARGGMLSSHAVTTPSFMEPGAVSKPLIFLVDLSSNVVNIYLQTGKNKMVGQVTGYGPGGIATDAAANLYVTNSTASYGNVLVFAPPYTGPPTLTLDDPGYYPTNVAISPQGIVAVLNYCSAPSCGYGTGNLLFYAQNTTTQCATVTDPTNFAYPESLTFDDKGNLFIDGENASGGTTIGEVTGGCAATNITLLTTTNTIKVPGGIHVDKADRIAIFEPILPGSNRPGIYSYKHPRMGSLGNPVKTTPLDAAAGCVDEFAFQATSHNVFVADFCDGVSAEYDYPAGGAAEKTIAVGANEPVSVAVTPPTIP